MKTPTHIYVSGPMRNRDGFNFPAFFEAEAALRQQYPEADICNPAREDVVRFGLQHLLAEDPTGLTAGRYLMETAEFGEKELRKALGGDLAYICEFADLLVMLPGWRESGGARAEAATAAAIGTTVAEVHLPLEEPENPVSASPAAESGVHVHSRCLATAAGSGKQCGNSPLKGRGLCRWHSNEKGESTVRMLDNGHSTGETRATSGTGGQKGVKLAAFDQVSPEVERLVAEHFGKGARKYDAHNFRRGYPWSLSYSALRRHLADFWSGKEYDVCPEDGAGCRHTDLAGKPIVGYGPGTCFNHTGSLSIVAVIWHAMVLTEFYLHRGEYDDRYVYTPDE